MAFRAQNFLPLGGRVSWAFYVLLLILVVAAGLRLNGVNWDQGFAFHPDERDIYMRSGCMYDLLADAPNALRCGYVLGEPDAEPGLPGVGTLLVKDRSPLKPHWFPLGCILIYILVFYNYCFRSFDFSTYVGDAKTAFLHNRFTLSKYYFCPEMLIQTRKFK